MTLDQDSVCSVGMVATLNAHMDSTVGIVTPYVVDRNKLTLAEYGLLRLPPVERYRQAARRGAITSGSLIPLHVWQEVGGYDERFFIDYVDYDFNQRVMNAGYAILRANRASILHEVGRAQATWLRVPRRTISGRWEVERFYSFGHSPSRCYYKARNRVLFTRKHGRQIGITNEGIWQLPQQIALTLLFESGRNAKFTGFVRGAVDGLRMQL